MAPLVAGISGACYKKYSTRQAAEEVYQRSLDAGAVGAAQRVLFPWPLFLGLLHSNLNIPVS